MIDLDRRSVAVEVRTLTDASLLAAAVLILADGLMSIPVWGLEGNPIVLAIGPTAMLATKVVGVAALLWLWFGDRGPRDSPLATAMPWCLLGLYGAVVGSNVAVLAVVA